MTIAEFNSLDTPEVKLAWEMYYEGKKGLWANYELACALEQILRRFKTLSIDFKVFVFYDDKKVLGIIPLNKELFDDELIVWNYAFDGLIFSPFIGVEYEKFEMLKDHLPRPFILGDFSWKFSGDDRRYNWVANVPTNIIDLKVEGENKFETYMAGLEKSSRASLRNCINRNSDIQIVCGAPDPIAFNRLHEAYYQYWEDRMKDADPMDKDSLFIQLQVYPLLARFAAKEGNLVDLSFYQNGELVAYNQSVIEGDTLIDYVCYRKASEELNKRSLGIFAIIENIRHVQIRYPQVRWYDLAGGFDYKKKFVNTQKSLNLFLMCNNLAELDRITAKKSEYLPPFIVGKEVILEQ